MGKQAETMGDVVGSERAGFSPSWISKVRMKAWFAPFVHTEVAVGGGEAVWP